MKNVLLICILLICSILGFSQDTIIKRNSEKIIAKIIEINTSEIKYKKFAFQDGPTYIEKKADIKMIVYANGMKEEFEEEKLIITETKTTSSSYEYLVKEAPVSNRIDVYGQNNFKYKNRYLSEREIQNVLLKTNDKKIMSLVGSAKDAKKAQYFGFAGIPLGIGAGALAITSLVYGSNNAFGVEPRYIAGAAVCALAAIACPIVAVTLKSKRNKYNREAVKMYNEKF